MSTPNTHHGAEYIKKIMTSSIGGSVFFAGAGGIMMSSLALLTKDAGIKVFGSDRAKSALTDKLEESGIVMYFSHSAENIAPDCKAFIYTVAISEDNPEYVEAQRRGIPCISRADYLGYIMTEYKNRIGVAGMHGKSTVTSMLAEIFLCNEEATGSKPTIISGATYKKMGGAYYLGEREHFVFEACEYMDSFLDFNPTVAVLLNAEMEHVDYFKSIDQIIESFSKYASLTGKDGVCVANADDEYIMSAVENYPGKLITFGLSDGVNYCAKNIRVGGARQIFELYIDGNLYGDVSVAAYGKHNIYNALAAFAAAYSVGISPEIIKNGLDSFAGAGRRMEYKGKISGADIYDDYGHHPTEAKATLLGARDMAKGRLICVFQPHTYSRTAALIDKFPESFSMCDKVVFCDIYAAREENIYGVSSRDLASVVGDKAIYGGSIADCAEVIKNEIREGDTVIIMGAGDIFKIYKMLGL